MSALARAKSLFTWRRVWGLGILLLGLPGQLAHWGWISLDIFGRLDLLWRVVETMGGSPALIASVISSWQFSISLIVIGLAYTVFVGEPKSGVQRHTWWPYIAASVFFICLTTMASIAIYGAYEVQMRKAYAAGALGIPRNSSPSSPQNNSNQRPLYSGKRTLLPDQKRVLIDEGGRLHAKLSGIPITYLETDMEAFGYASEINATLAQAAIHSGGVSAQPLGEPGRTGVIIEVANKSIPPESAVQLQQLLLIADVQAAFADTIPQFRNVPVVLFIGPQPIER